MTSPGAFTELRASVAETARRSRRADWCSGAGNVQCPRRRRGRGHRERVHLIDATVDDVTVVHLTAT